MQDHLRLLPPTPILAALGRGSLYECSRAPRVEWTHILTAKQRLDTLDVTRSSFSAAKASNVLFTIAVNAELIAAIVVCNYEE